ncbi:MAG: MraY family glycosyltransferase [Spirochaetota bacterium]
MNKLVEFLIIVVAALCLNLILIPLLLSLSHRFRWYDDIDHRKIHKGDIPRIGGIGLFLSFIIVSLAVFALSLIIPLNHTILPVVNLIPFLIGIFLIHLLGLLDDFSNLRARFKLVVQITAAALTAIGGFRLKDVLLPFSSITISLGPFSYIVTIFWIIGMCNAVNLIDGLDGLAGGISAIAAFFFGAVSLIQGDITAAIFSFALFGSLAGFLAYNFPPAKLFMGDSGSLFLGFVIASLPLMKTNGESKSNSLIFIITLMMIPVLDTLAAIVRRIKRKIPIHNPDREHIHHKLLHIGFSNRKILAVIYSICFFLGIISVIWKLTSEKHFFLMIIGAWLLGVVFLVIVNHIAKKHFSLDL